jgi:ATP-dependent helicase/nuclease subunit A
MNEVERLGTVLPLYARVQTLERSKALFTLSLAIGETYTDAKARRGALDFDDLIERTLSLLQRSDARWVLFKLDQGIDHLLVDEAQDTSPIQWDILKALTDDFFSGESSRTALRTVFAVGDPKQSIYSFQGAEPHSFSQSADFFASRIKALPQERGGRFAPVNLQLSFRSSEIILQAVDAIFAPLAHHQGLEHPAKAPVHEARRADLPGLVELWPLIEAEKAEDTEEWIPALSADAPLPPAVLLAQKIARTIASWLAPESRERVHELDAEQKLVARKIRAGDILILVRKRSAFFDDMIRALKDHAIPVAGADRLSLINHIAVMDLMALGQAALRPEDDLALACVLKSPLFNLNDEDLLILAPTRRASLAAELARNPAYQEAQTRFALFCQWAKDYGPFGFFSRVLNEALAREALLSRLGLEAADVIDAFLNAAQEHEYNKTPSLYHFLHDFIEAQTEIKRDMEAGRDEVRVMTVHGAKGLEAPIVFIPETTSLPDGKNQTHFPPLANNDNPVPVWSLNKTANPDAVNAALDAILAKQHDEYRRIFYVALTRARERLYIAGFTGHNGAEKLKPETWYGMARTGLQDLALPLDPDQPDTSIRRLTDPRFSAVDESQPVETTHPAKQRDPLPDWLRKQAPAESEPQPPIKPSNALTAADRRARPLDTPWQRKAQQRGTLFHRLLELLPQIEPALQAKAAQRLVSARGAFLNAQEQAALCADCLAILHDPNHAALFGPDSQAEVAISGTIPLGPAQKSWPVMGQIDRLAIKDTAVLVCDYKTSLTPPTTLSAIPATSLAQLALYQALLRTLYPDKPVKAFVLYTSGATLFELPDAITDSALESLGTVTQPE